MFIDLNLTLKERARNTAFLVGVTFGREKERIPFRFLMGFIVSKLEFRVI